MRARLHGRGSSTKRRTSRSLACRRLVRRRWRHTGIAADARVERVVVCSLALLLHVVS